MGDRTELPERQVPSTREAQLGQPPAADERQAPAPVEEEPSATPFAAQHPPPARRVGQQDEHARVQRLRAGDEQAFTDLLQEHHGPLLRLIRIFVSNASVAEEVAQETWAAVIQGLRRFEGRASLRTWIFRIAANRARSRAVREKRSSPFSDLERNDTNAVDPARFRDDGRWSEPPRLWEEETPERLLQQQQALECLNAALHELPESQQAVVVLRDMEGLSAAEACNILELSETNQRVLLHRARARLRAALEAHLDRK